MHADPILALPTATYLPPPAGMGAGGDPAGQPSFADDWREAGKHDAEDPGVVAAPALPSVPDAAAISPAATSAVPRAVASGGAARIGAVPAAGIGHATPSEAPATEPGQASDDARAAAPAVWQDRTQAPVAEPPVKGARGLPQPVLPVAVSGPPGLPPPAEPVFAARLEQETVRAPDVRQPANVSPAVPDPGPVSREHPSLDRRSVTGLDLRAAVTLHVPSPAAETVPAEPVVGVPPVAAARSDHAQDIRLTPPVRPEDIARPPAEPFAGFASPGKPSAAGASSAPADPAPPEAVPDQPDRARFPALSPSLPSVPSPGPALPDAPPDSAPSTDERRATSASGPPAKNPTGGDRRDRADGATRALPAANEAGLDRSASAPVDPAPSSAAEAAFAAEHGLQRGDTASREPQSRTPVGLSGFGVELAARLREAAAPGPDLARLHARGDGTLTLTLAPEELGTLTIDFAGSTEDLRIVVRTERAETQDILRRHVQEFLSDLRAAGFGHATLDFGQGGRGASGHAFPDSLNLPEPDPDGTEPPHRPELMSRRPPPARAAAGGLDLRL